MKKLKMKKLNKKGFAISTLIYGLSILGLLLITMLMSTLSNTRSNAKEMSNAIEEDLNRYSRTSVSFSPSKKSQEFITPDGESGWYRIELWGAQGNNGKGGEGAYTTGIIELQEGDTLYFYVGKQGESGAGGGETSVRIDNGDDEGSISSRIMVAGGGGADYNAKGSTITSYLTTNSQNMNYDNSTKKITASDNLTGMTYSEIKDEKSYPITYNEENNAKESGKGYYNGKSGKGGTSFISGYAGATAYSAGVLSGTKYTYHEYSYESKFSQTAGRSYYFYDGMMLEGVKTGDGLARIERVIRKSEGTQTLPKQNEKLKKVMKVRDCTDNNIASNTSMAVIKDGESLSLNRNTTSDKCVIYSLNTTTPIEVDEIAVWHELPEKQRDVKNEEISVYDGASWINIKNKASSYKGVTTSKSITETPNGIHISAYQPDFTSSIIPSGNYYMFSVTSSNKVLTIALSSNQVNNSLQFENIVGGNNQKWTISPIECKLYDSEVTRTSCSVNNTGYPSDGVVEYKIEDLVRFFALNILLDENKINNTIVANNTFNDLTRNAPSIWRINSLGNGTVVISSSVDVFSSNVKAGGLTYLTEPISTSDNVELKNKLLISSLDSIDVSRFYLYRLNF